MQIASEPSTAKPKDGSVPSLFRVRVGIGDCSIEPMELYSLCLALRFGRE
jgi:hypothetical protein